MKRDKKMIIYQDYGHLYKDDATARLASINKAHLKRVTTPAINRKNLNFLKSLGFKLKK